MALASGAGMAATSRPIGFHRPATTTSTPTRAKAPSAAANPPSIGPVVASSAAPGVDQAMLIGMRETRLSRMAVTLIVTPSASRPEAACSVVAPMATRPSTMTVTELP